MSSDKLIELLANKVPELLVMLAIVIVFLKQLKNTTNDFVTVVKEIHTENLQARINSQRVIEENTKQTALCSFAMQEMTNTMKVAIGTGKMKV